MTPDQAIEALTSICFQYDLERIKKLKDSGNKLAHYTTAENGLKIIQGKTIWLRNAAVMNDFSEIQHGRSCLNWTFENTDALTRLNAIFDPHYPGLCNEVMQWLNDADLNSRLFTYMTAVAEHSAHDQVGKLSMWRAYGGSAAGVALVLNPSFIDSDNQSLQAVTSPVLYATPERFAQEMLRIVTSLEASHSVVAAVPKETAKHLMFNAFRYAILSTKHPSFEEEQEWRVLHSPRDSSSAFVIAEPVAIRGIAQLVYKLPLEDRPGMNFPEVELERLLDRVIVGPTQFPIQVAEAFDEAMTKAGLSNVGNRIKVSHIPLRHVH